MSDKTADNNKKSGFGMFLRRLRIDRTALTPRFAPASVSEEALATAAEIRGANRNPVIMLHGVLPRSGTVYSARLFRLHPDVHAYPHDIWELPFLDGVSGLLNFEKRFFAGYRHNAEKLGQHDFLALFGASLIAHLHRQVDDDKHVFMKMPSMKYLSYFDVVFPHEKLIILMRDGRDVVNSQMNTWPNQLFSQACRRWKLAAEMAMACEERYRGTQRCWAAKFEDAVADPAGFMRDACEHLGLRVDRYPFDEIESVGVKGSSTMKQEGKVTWDLKPRPENFNPVGRWADWSRRRKRTFDRIAGDTLARAGYRQTSDW